MGHVEKLADNLKETEYKSALIDRIVCGIYHEAALLSEKRTDGFISPDDIAELYTELHEGASPSSSPDRFALFCSEIASVYTSHGGVIFPDIEPDTKSQTISIAYLQNSFSDRAYKVFASEFKRVGAQYFPGFREVCEEVYYGRCSHAILPIYSSNDGQLMSFRKLIAKYDLRISLVTDVEMNDDSVMRFALLQKVLDRYHLTEMHDQLFLDISAVLPYGMKFGGFLSACEVFGADLVTANSHPLEYSDDVCGISLQFDVTNASLSALYIFLEGLHIRYDTLGLYGIIQ